VLLIASSTFEISASASSFAIGNLVEVCDSAGLKVRDSPAGNPITTEPYGSRGIIRNGPRSASLGGVTYTWWYIEWKDGVKGWSAEGYPGGVYYIKKVPPEAPTALSPGSSSEPGPIIDTFTPTLQWQASFGADYYALAISEYPYGLSNIIYNPQQIYGTSHTIPAGVLQPGKKYRWNLQAHSSGGWSPVSNTLYFQTSGGKPDLTVIGQVSFTPSSVFHGQSLSVKFTVKNAGSSSSGSFYVRISLATTEYGTDYSLGNFQVSSLSTGESRTISQTTNPIPSSVPAGSYYVTVFVDGFQQIDESNEYNNIGSSTPNKVEVRAPSATYDYTISISGLGSGYSTKVYLDGVQKTTLYSGQSYKFSGLTGTHTISVDSIVNDGTNIRYLCGSNSITVSGSGSYTFNYKTQYYITISVNPSGSGTVPPGSNWYDAESTISISASPSPGYKFKNWSISGSITITNPDSPSTTAKINGPGSITANFEKVEQFNFEISITPPTRTIKAGESTTFSITVSLLSGATQTVMLSLSGQHNTMSYNFNPSSGSPTFTSTLTISTTSSTPANTYTLTITGTGGGITKQQQAILVIQPRTPTLTFTSLEPSIIETSESTYDANLIATGTNFYNVIQITFSWSGPDSGSVTWNKGDNNWNTKVTVHSDTSMTLRPRVLYQESSTQQKTWTWTVTLKDNTGATASKQFTVIYKQNFSTSITDQQKQQEILKMVNSHRGSLPPELVLAIIRQEGGEGAFHINGWNYNPFYKESDGSWAQPINGDGIMQVTVASGYHERSGPYTHDRDGYDHAIKDGCDYLLELYNTYGSYAQAVLHYNTGPNTLYIYLGKNLGDRNYLSHIATHLSDFVPSIYGLRNQNLVDALNRAQKILNDYLYNKGIATGQSLDYYRPYQILLDRELYNIEHPTPTTSMSVQPTTWSYSIGAGSSKTQIFTVSASGGTVKGVTVAKISGPDWITVSPTNLGDIPAGSSKTFTVTASPPAGTTGSFSYSVRVTCTEGEPKIIDISGTITVTPPPNKPPYTPSNPLPKDGSTNLPTSLTLSWTGGDPDGDKVTYEVYLGTTPTPPLYSSTVETSIQVTNLKPDTTYYWKIIAKDDKGARTEGPLWKFTTAPTSLPDLTVTMEKIVEILIIDKQPIIPPIAIIEKNVGDADAANHSDRVIITIEGILTVRPLERRHSLRAGESSQLPLPELPPLPPGKYKARITVILDVFNEVKESNEQNNVWECLITIEVVQPPQLTVISPNGGEVWVIGSIQTIKWEFKPAGPTPITTYVKIDLSRDGGKTWETIIPETIDDGSEPWTVTGPPTENALIRVTSL
jgi:VCBS repeat-containing protein